MPANAGIHVFPRGRQDVDGRHEAGHDGSKCSPPMTERLKPRDAKDVADAVGWALSAEKPVEIIGQGSKRALGRPAQADLMLDLSGLSGVTLYEPEELVLRAGAGTSLAEIEALTAAHGQQLAFEPMDCGPLFGPLAGHGSIGGVLAVNFSGPRRIQAGAARDHFLGVTAVSGRAEIFKSGGRVVKNVTGYDLCKLLAGSFGTLAAMTEVTIKTLPKPEADASVVLLGLDDDAALRALTAAVALPCEVSGAAHLPARVAARVAIGEVVASGRALTALRLEGVPPSVAHRKSALQTVLRSFGEVSIVDDIVSRNLWRAIRDVAPFAASRTGPEQPLWRVSTAPYRGTALMRHIADKAAAEVLYDWAGGLLWVLLEPADDAGAGVVRAAVAACGGHATLVRAAAAIRAAIPVFEPQAEPLAALTRRVKESFDPKRVLNPGRMWAGV
jgi:glycolate oxidase FAD binding subunit